MVQTSKDSEAKTDFKQELMDIDAVLGQYCSLLQGEGYKSIEEMKDLGVNNDDLKDCGVGNGKHRRLILKRIGICQNAFYYAFLNVLMQELYLLFLLFFFSKNNRNVWK